MNTLLRTLAVSLLLVSHAIADGPGFWWQWRGPSGQGYVTDTKVPLEWSETKNFLWKTKVPGAGHSTPVIWGELLFLTSANKDGSKRWVVCVNTTSGKIDWEQLAAEGIAEKTHGTSSLATASCVTDGKHVYAFFGTPGMFCYTLEGKPVWHHKFGIFTSEANWGVGASPVLYENLVIQNCDNDGTRVRSVNAKDVAAPNLVALEKETGKVVWSTPRDQGRGFSTPVLIAANGRDELVLNGPLGVWAYDPKTGKELWHCDRHPDIDNNKFGEPLPLFANGTMFAAAGRESGYLQAIKLGGSGDVTRSGLVWELPRRNVRDVGSGILVGKQLYFGDSRGFAISSHDVASGKQLFSVPTRGGSAQSSFYASPVLIKDKVVFLRRDGKTFVVEPGTELKIVHINELSDGTDFSASPAVADGKLFLRSQTHLYCIGEKK